MANLVYITLELCVHPILQKLFTRKNEIFQLQLKLAENRTSIPWKMMDLDAALKNLKNNKSRDHAGYVNEIFKSQVIGQDLKLSLLQMCNRIKSKGIYSTVHEICKHNDSP